MKLQPFTLAGKHVRLDPLGPEHADALVAASTAAHPQELYSWSPVPQTKADAIRYVETALAWREAGTAFPFVTISVGEGRVIGSTRFFEIERWPWPAGHRFHNRPTPDACEIGYTWLTASAVRTAANTEAKLLMLTHAFENWQLHRVCFHTDVRNDRSRKALARIGGCFEGILRAHRMAADLVPRDSARFSIIQAEWPALKQKLRDLLKDL
jgi:RimJ/RimL family protein N-acetyltransferase